jgi:hypothetical protein
MGGGYPRNAPLYYLPSSFLIRKKIGMTLKTDRGKPHKSDQKDLRDGWG